MSHCGIKKVNAFTLTEVLLSVLIVGILAALVIPAIVTSYQTKALDEAFKRETQTIEQSIKSLTVNENKTSFFDTIMYSTSTDYDNTAGKYLKKYLRISKYCGTNNGNCFAKKYYEYKDHDKKEYKPNYKGACASLKNGMSLCLTPQVGGASIEGLIDLNGSKGPNVVGRDLRTFTINPETLTAVNKGQFEAVKSTDYLVESIDPCAGKICGCGTLPACTDPCEGLTCGCGTLPACDVCKTDPNGLACCQTKTITSITDACCNYSAIKNANAVCTVNKQCPDLHFEAFVLGYVSPEILGEVELTIDVSTYGWGLPRGHSYELCIESCCRTWIANDLGVVPVGTTQRYVVKLGSTSDYSTPRYLELMNPVYPFPSLKTSSAILRPGMSNVILGGSALNFCYEADSNGNFVRYLDP